MKIVAEMAIFRLLSHLKEFSLTKSTATFSNIISRGEFSHELSKSCHRNVAIPSDISLEYSRGISNSSANFRFD